MSINVNTTFISELEKSPQFKQLCHELKLPKLSKSSNKMLKVWYLKIKESFEKYKVNQNSILNTLIEEATLNKVSEFTLIPKTLKDVIDRVCVNNYSFSIKISSYNSDHERVFKVYICAPLHYTRTKIENMINLISTWYFFVNDFVDNECSNTVNIYLYLIPNKKSLPENNVIIDREHVNTAFTTTCAVKTNVHIFREEEWFRALIHESFHNLGLDFIRMGDSKIKLQEGRINKAFHTNILDIRLYETYCEMWAEVLNLLFYVYINRPSENYRWKVEFFRLLKYEQAFTILQCVKILQHNGMSYDTMDDSGHLYKENTNTFSYYILKCILSVHLDQFLDFCSNQYDENEYSLQFRKNVHNLNKYTSMIIRNRKSNRMKATTKVMEHANLTDLGVKKTLRMSLFEIDILSKIEDNEWK